MALQQKMYTNAEFWAFARRPENEHRRLELIDGVIYEKGQSMAPSNRRNTIVAGRILHYLNAHVIPNDLGYVAGADSGFDLGPGQIRQPDTAFIAKDRVADLDGTTFDGAPDLAVEVISPNESPRRVLDKVRLYLETGGQMVWTVYAEDKVVDVYRLGEEGTLLVDTYRVGDRLTGGAVLPGFTLAVDDIFPN